MTTENPTTEPRTGHDDWREPTSEQDCIERLALLAAELADFDAQQENRKEDRDRGELDPDEFNRWEKRWRIARRYRKREHEALTGWLAAYRDALPRTPEQQEAEARVRERDAEARILAAKASLAKQERLAALQRTQEKLLEARLDPTSTQSRAEGALRAMHLHACETRWVLESLVARGVDLGAQGRKVLYDVRRTTPEGFWEAWLTESFPGWNESALAHDHHPEATERDLAEVTRAARQPHVNLQVAGFQSAVRLQSASGGLESVRLFTIDESGLATRYEPSLGQAVACPARLTPSDARLLAATLLAYADSHPDTEET